jgi:3-carboxy-cis,cis-muconate cycloisomerase
MRRSSSPSESLFGPLFGDPAVDAELSDAAVLRAMLDVEAALARAQAACGVVPAPAAEAIAAACAARDADPDVRSLAGRSQAAGNPVVPRVRDLTAAVPEHARPFVHHGATSQDVLDTALALVARRSLGPLLRALAGAGDAAADLADRHRADVLAGRTLGQQAAVTTFGMVAAGWLHGLDAAQEALRAAGDGLAVSFGGPVGTLAALGGAGPAVVDRLAAELGLAAPVLPWHTDRQRVLALAAALARVAVAAGKVAGDVVLLAQSEVGEVAEGGDGRGGSSALPHKRNPVDAVLVTAAARRAPGLAATLFAAGVHEHQRATGAWHAEWEPLLDLLSLTGGAACRTGALLGRLRVDTGRMRRNLAATGGLLMAESVAALLAPSLGRTAAHDLVAECAADAARRGVPLRTVLTGDPRVTAAATAEQIDTALDETRWLGSAQQFVTAALRWHAARRRPAEEGTT